MSLQDLLAGEEMQSFAEALKLLANLHTGEVEVLQAQVSQLKAVVEKLSDVRESGHRSDSDYESSLDEEEMTMRRSQECNLRIVRLEASRGHPLLEAKDRPNFRRSNARIQDEEESDTETPVVTRWRLLMEKMREDAHFLTRTRLCRKDAEFDLLPHWLKPGGRKSIPIGQFWGASTSGQNLIVRVTRYGDTIKDKTCLQQLVVHPMDSRRLAWGLVGLLSLCIDTVFIPVQMFDLSAVTTVLRGIGWVSTSYWIIDLLVQFLTGYQMPTGQIELRPSAIRAKYLKTWLIVDACVLLCDLIVFSMDRAGDVSGAGAGMQAGGRSLRLARVLRLVRLVKLLRIRHFPEVMSLLTSQVRSEHVLLAGKLILHVTIILLISHYIACAWLALAIFAPELEFENTWLYEHNRDRESMGYSYLLSLHWGLTQFSPATQSIAPRNSRERLFAICVVLFALIAFSSFISSVTDAVNQLRKLNMARSVEERRLLEFMHVRRVPSALIGSVHRFFRDNYLKRRARLHEDSITFMNELPEAMTRWMHEEMYMPHIRSSTLNWFYNMDEAFLPKVCHFTMSEQSYLPLQEIFMHDEKTKSLFVSVLGLLHYDTQAPKMGSTRMSLTQEEVLMHSTVQEGMWMAEMNMWVQWAHKGSLRAGTSCELVKLDCEKLACVIMSCNSTLMDFLRKYAILLVGELESRPFRPSDTPLPEELVHVVLQRVVGFLKAEASKEFMFKGTFGRALSNSQHGISSGNSVERRPSGSASDSRETS